MEELFFELIRVAIGMQESLSRLPSECEWGNLYKMAEKQSLVGICFAALQMLGANADGGFARIGISEMLYFTWMGMAVKIQQRNEIVNQQCADLQMKLSADGFDSAILKGQGVANLYNGHLGCLRQSGDIDVWVKADPDRIIEYARSLGIAEDPTYLHVGVKIFVDTTVELHWRPTLLRNMLNNRKLQKWSDSFTIDTFRYLDGLGFYIPPDGFSRVFNLTHLYRHFIFEGVGMRQLLDYYFIMLNTTCSDKIEEKKLIKRFGMMRFTSAVMWVLVELFHMPKEVMICEADEKEGKYLLNEVMEMGNFGKADKRYKHDGVKIKLFKKWLHLIRHYPSEVVWNPIWILWRKIKRY